MKASAIRTQSSQCPPSSAGNSIIPCPNRIRSTWPARSASANASSSSSNARASSPPPYSATPRLLHAREASRSAPASNATRRLSSRSPIPASSPRSTRANPRVVRTSARTSSSPSASAAASASPPTRIASSWSPSSPRKARNLRQYACPAPRSEGRRREEQWRARTRSALVPRSRGTTTLARAAPALLRRGRGLRLRAVRRERPRALRAGARRPRDGARAPGETAAPAVSSPRRGQSSSDCS